MIEQVNWELARCKDDPDGMFVYGVVEQKLAARARAMLRLRQLTSAIWKNKDVA